MSMCECARPVGRPKVSEDPVQQWHHLRCLFYRVDGMSLKQVSERMGISRSTAKRWTQFALSYQGFPELRSLQEKLKRAQLADP